jgi:glucosamine-6-phosphate deaminase
MAETAAAYAVGRLVQLINTQGEVRLLAATGASQLEFLSYLTQSGEVDWKRVELFHLDEYVGIGIDHGASFARYIRDRLVEPTGIERYHLLNGLGNPAEVIAAANEAVSRAPIDLAFAGIGENAHLAFNDPPADFETTEPYLLVNLDEACRRQQVGEGWFPALADVPAQAFSMSVQQILKSKEILCVVPDGRKAEAVAKSLQGPVTPTVPASILQTHPDTRYFLDEFSAGKLV